MILFNLICGHDHEFEGWFRDGAAFDDQAAAGSIACPICRDSAIRKAPMAPHVIGERRSKPPSPDELRVALSKVRRFVEENCDYVGAEFPAEARRIHYGEIAERAIYGHATIEEARALDDEGIQIATIPWLPRHDS
jgi:hypothetical protein